MNWDWNSALGMVVIASVLLGVAGGTMGVWVVARRMALTGDVLSHAVLPGVVGGLMWSRSPGWVLLGAMASGWLGAWCLNVLTRRGRLKQDAAMGVVLTVFFAAGLAMVSKWEVSGVNAFLFGQVAALTKGELAWLAGMSGLVALVMGAGFRWWLAASFDRRHAATAGMPVVWLDRVFYFLLTATLVVAMQAAGVVLVTSLLITPALAAACCSGRLTGQWGWACGIGVAGCLMGAVGSMRMASMPTGPTMTLALLALWLAAVAAGPHDGWWVRRRRRMAEQRRIEEEDGLKRMWMAEESGKPGPLPPPEVLERLEKAGWAVRGGGGWGLSEEGKSRAVEMVRKHRLWEVYLAERTQIPAERLHPVAEVMEHWTDESHYERLEGLWGEVEKDPHGTKIPPRDGAKPERREP